MSGIVGIVRSDGQPIDPSLLEEMTDLMQHQAPDAREIWSDGRVGFGHALLRTTWESENEQQPLSLDGNIWITGDIRLDRRQELLDRLLGAGETVEDRHIPDVNLVWHSYRAWGEACLDYLSGDFAFAIWDSQQQHLFCARDQFGIVPFYYAQLGQILVFSNHLNTVRFHPAVSDRLNESAIADFLLFGMKMDRTTTTFADIQQLPPAHVLTYSEGRISVRCYWQLPEEVEYLQYQRPEDYVEQFRELFERSVSDRLRTHRAGTHLSGGMDSTSIAATAYKQMRATGASVDFRSYAIVYNHLIPDEEGDYAKEVAEMADFPIEYLVAEDYLQQAPGKHPEYIYPEPLLIPEQAAEVEIMRRVAGYSRVLLAGFGGDPLLYPAPSSQDKLPQNPNNLWGYLRSLRARVRLRTRLRHWLQPEPEEQPNIELPNWLNPDFVERANLKARQQEILSVTPQKDRYGMATAPLWSNIFAWSDPGFTGFPVKVRFPFFDLRLVLYLLSVPPVPWFEDKFLLREAMEGVLPQSVCQRPKTTLQGFPHYNLMQQRGLQPWMVELMAVPELRNYVNGDLLLQRLQFLEKLTPASYTQGGIVLQLSYWLRHR